MSKFIARALPPVSAPYYTEFCLMVEAEKAVYIAEQVYYKASSSNIATATLDKALSELTLAEDTLFAIPDYELVDYKFQIGDKVKSFVEGWSFKKEGIIIDIVKDEIVVRFDDRYTLAFEYDDLELIGKSF